MSRFQTLPNYQYPVIPKDPGARLDYSRSWQTWLPAGDTISAVAVEITSDLLPAPGDLVDAGHATASGVVTLWLTGGLAGVDYTVAITVTTAAGRTDTRRFIVAVQER